VCQETKFVGIRSEDAYLGSPKTALEEKPPSKRVLVVDDEQVIADTLTTILRMAGYEASASYDGLSALSQCASFSPDLVISDVVMPGMNGVKMAIQLKQRYPACKIFLFSGQAATVNALEEGQQSGYDFELLAKPINPCTLLARLSQEAAQAD
jgi:CheY-like chemotaxis protein